jgi:3'-phosphoadenosine 5'-phosphosulfate sulfotransferase (PAPS reductase)/FAD synthetase
MKGALKARSCLAVEARATFHLDRDVRKVQQVRKALLIRARSLWMIGYHRDDSGHVTGTNAPKVKVRNLVAMRFEPFDNFHRESMIRRKVQQYSPCGSD